MTQGARQGRASRRTKIVVAVLAGLLVILGAVATFVWFRAGDIVARRAERLLRERWDLEAHVDTARVGFGGVFLDGVSIRIPEVDHFAIRVDQVHLVGAPLAIATRRLAAVELIEVRGLDVHAQLDDALLRALAARRRPASAEPAEPADTGAPRAERPPVHVEDGAIELLDEQGMLVRALSVRAEMTDTTIALGAGVLELGDERSDHVRFEHLDAELRRDERWRVATLGVENAEARWALSLDTLDQAADVRLVRRMREVVAKVRSALGRGAADEPAAEGSRLDRLTTRDFALRVARASVATSGDDDARRIALTDLGLGRLDATRLRLSGQGTGHDGIDARWNLEVDPEALRAEGTMRVTRLPLALVGPLVPDVPWEASMPGLVSIDVEFHARGLDEVSVRGSLEVEGAALDSRRISSAPIRDLAVRIEGEGTLRPLERRLVLGAARFSTGGVTLGWQGRIELGRGHYEIRGSLAMPRTSCDRAVHAIPVDVLGSLAGFRLSGELGGRLDIDLDGDALERTRLDVTVDDQCVFDEAPPEADLARFEVPFQHEVLEPDGTVFSMETGPETSNWVAYSAISPYVIEAVISHEDAAFFRHSGFAPWAIRDAVVRNLREGRYVVGASTITMQLAKNLFLHREKTLIRKVQEVLLTWWLERSLDKERILELYLNVIEYGPAVYGLRNASRYYFGSSPAAITPVGAAFLANILPAPKHYGVPASGTFGDGMRSRLGHFLEHMAGQGRLDELTLAAAMEELATFRFRDGGGSTILVPANHIEHGGDGRDDGRNDEDGTNPMDWMPPP